MTSRIERRRFIADAALGATSLILLRSLAARAAPSFKTVSPGVLTVAINGDMPMTSVKDGKLIGTDGEMIVAIAEKLGLEAKPSLMEWSATIESVRTGRADIMLGNMGWTPVRAKVLAVTDAIYYAGQFATMKKDVPLDEVTIADLSGRSIGTVTGFTVVPEMKKVPGTTAVKLYDTTNSCIRDVVAGRLDFAFLDPPTVDYMISAEPRVQPETGPHDPGCRVPSAHKQELQRDGHERRQSRPLRRDQRRRRLAVAHQAQRQTSCQIRGGRPGLPRPAGH